MRRQYYLAGALKIINNVSHQIKDVYSSSLENIGINVLTHKERARNDSLPLVKVKAREIINLCFANKLFSKSPCMKYPLKQNIKKI
jgi:hypothetical protein